jgi:hypothetical protein
LLIPDAPCGGPPEKQGSSCQDKSSLKPRMDIDGRELAESDLGLFFDLHFFCFCHPPSRKAAPRRDHLRYGLM